MERKESAAPEPGTGDVRVEVRAVGLNRADLLQVQGQYPPPPGFDPKIPGLEYAGVIEAVGAGVTQRHVGERVMGLVPGEAYAEYIVTTEREAIPIPEGFSMTEAAAMPEAFLTAYRALVIEGGLGAGDRAMIRPVTAGVGLAAARLARALGARVVGVSRSQQRLEQAQSLGLTFIEPVMDSEAGIAKAVSELTSGGVDVAMDMVTGAQLQDTLASLNTEGRAVMVGLLGGLNAELNLGSLLMRRGGLKAMTMRAQPLEERIRHAQIFQHRLTPLFADGTLQPDLAQVFPFTEAPAAQDALARSEQPGKIVMEL